MIEIARQMAGPVPELHVADLDAPLDFLDTESFDLVVSSLALDYCRDWRTPFGEFRRVLKDGGRLVITVQHPMSSYAWMQPPTAFGVHYGEASWREFTPTPVLVPYHYRSMAEIFNPVLTAGFRLVRIEETRPLPELAGINPRKYEQGMRFPTFLLIEATAT